MKRQRGASAFEFVVATLIIVVLAAALLSRLIEVAQEQERLEVRLTLRHIETGIKLAIGEKLMRGEDSRLSELLETNPLTFLAHAPAARGQPARWRYDAARRELIYEPRQPQAFSGQTRLTWCYLGRRDEQGRLVGIGLEALKSCPPQP
ncbi:MAG: hypothetical protein N2441_05755 [Rhodocyclaceae bacterium]|nr:hypothetical protein [Rhodocyclaceae bacterium]